MPKGDWQLFPAAASPHLVCLHGQDLAEGCWSSWVARTHAGSAWPGTHAALRHWAVQHQQPALQMTERQTSGSAKHLGSMLCRNALHVCTVNTTESYVLE